MNSIATGYELTKAFYAEVEQNEAMQIGCKPHHQSLYTWICELRNRMGREILDLPVLHTLRMSFIGSEHTLAKVIEDLQQWGIIELVSKVRGQNTKVRLSIAFMQKHCNSSIAEMQKHSNSPAIAVQITKTNKRVKTSKNSESVPTSETKVAFRQNVQLLQTEFDTLVDEFGPAFTERCLDKLSHYKLSKGKTYKSDYGAIRQWVIEALQDKQNRSGPPAAATTAPPPPKDRPLR